MLLVGEDNPARISPKATLPVLSEVEATVRLWRLRWADTREQQAQQVLKDLKVRKVLRVPQVREQQVLKVRKALRVPKVLKGRKVHRDVRMIVVPASTEVYQQAMDEGLLSIFTKEGAFVSGPTCAACLGGHMGVLAKGEKCVSSTNRNFIGRMGHRDSEVYLAGPAVVAASAVAGKIVSPEVL